ncbi:MAG TPA: ribulose-phosphate 3-epimerase [Ktedonobacterales bacterium]|nr:ribulose-phosphate 3-epimerase [Ktedonobacterales bacterium]
MALVVPSILSADFGRLGAQVAEAQAGGADRLQIDVMDGRFVPNITVGPLVVEAVRRATSLPLEAHLMIVEPERYVADFAQAGADLIIVHQEVSPHLHRTIEQIKRLGKRAGVAINPATPLADLQEILNDVDLVLCMTVDPGFGGQQFISSVLSKIARLRAMMEQHGARCDLEVDGGIHSETAPQVVKAGANVLVAGSAVFGDPNGVAAGIQRLRQAIEATGTPG